MFQAIKRTWNVNRVYRQMRSLWSEFMNAFSKSSSEYKLYGVALDEFCRFFVKSHDEYLSDSSNLSDASLDSVFGDCAEIMTTMIEVVENLQSSTRPSKSKSLTPSALSASLSLSTTSSSSSHDFRTAIHLSMSLVLRLLEVFYRHEKYRTKVRESVALLPRLVHFLDTLSDPVCMKIVLQILGNLTRDAECKLEIGRMNGFQKMFALLVAADDELQSEILKTLRLFLSLDDSSRGTTDASAECANNKSVIKRAYSATDVSSLGPAVASNALPPLHHSASSSSSSSSASTSSASTRRFSIPKWGQQILSQLPKSAIYHIQRLFYKTAFPQNINADASLLSQASSDALTENGESFFPPSFDSIADVLGSREFDEMDHQLSLAMESPASSSMTSSSCSSSSPKSDDLPSVAPPLQTVSSDNTLRELMRMQGVLQTLTSSLAEKSGSTATSANAAIISPAASVSSSYGASVTVQLEMLSTLTRLLLDNPALQREFRSVNGYVNLTSMLVQATSAMHSSASFDSSPTSIATLDNLPAGQPKRSPMITPRMVTGQSPRDSHQLPHLPHASPSESSASTFSTDLNWSQALPSHISMPQRAQPNLQAGFLLDSVFRTAITLMLDAHPQKMIRNFDALHWVLELACGAQIVSQCTSREPVSITIHPSISESTHPAHLWQCIRMRALQCLQDVVSINPLNAAVIKKVGGATMLLQLLNHSCGVRTPPSTAASSATPTACTSSAASASSSVHLSRFAFANDGAEPAMNSILQEVIGDDPSVSQDELNHTWMERVDFVLQYLACSLTFHDHDIASHYIELVLAIHQFRPLPRGPSLESDQTEPQSDDPSEEYGSPAPAPAPSSSASSSSSSNSRSRSSSFHSNGSSNSGGGRSTTSSTIVRVGPTPPFMRLLLMRAVASFTRHFALFGVEIHDRLLETFLPLLRSMTKRLHRCGRHYQHRMSSADSGISDDQHTDGTNSDSSSRFDDDEIDSMNSELDELNPEDAALDTDESSSDGQPYVLDSWRVQEMLHLLELLGHSILSQSHSHSAAASRFNTSSELYSLESVGLRRPWRLALASLRKWCDLKGPELLMALVHPRFPTPIVDLSLYLMQRLVLLSHGPTGETHKFWQPLLEMICAPWLPPMLRCKAIRCALSVILCEDNSAITSAVMSGALHHPFTLPISPLSPVQSSSSNALLAGVNRPLRSSSGSLNSSSMTSIKKSHAVTALSGIKASFRDARGLLMLTDLLSALQMHEQDLAACVFYLFAEAISNCDSNKLFIGDCIGFYRMSEIIKQSPLSLDQFCFDVVFELATTGNLRSIMPSSSSSSISLLSWPGLAFDEASSPWRHRLCNPTLLFSHPLEIASLTPLQLQALLTQRVVDLQSASPQAAPIDVSSSSPRLQAQHNLNLFALSPSDYSSLAAAPAISGSPRTPKAPSSLNSSMVAAVSAVSGMRPRRSQSETQLNRLLASSLISASSTSQSHSPSLGSIPRPPSPQSTVFALASMQSSPRASVSFSRISSSTSHSSLMSAVSSSSIADMDITSVPSIDSVTSSSASSSGSLHSVSSSPSGSPPHASPLLAPHNSLLPNSSPSQFPPQISASPSLLSSPPISTSSMSANAPGWKELAGVARSQMVSRVTTTKFHSREAALMIVLLLPHAVLDIQREVIQRLAILLDANPSNKRALCQMQVIDFLLRLCPRFNEDILHFYLELVHTLAAYDISSQEVRLLFELALLRFDPSELAVSSSNESDLTQRCLELQMQMLYVIGRVAERVAPPNYFNFDGVGASLRLKTLERFPSSKYGYSFACWLKVNSFFDYESSLLTWQTQNPDDSSSTASSTSNSATSGSTNSSNAPSQKTVFELFFVRTPRSYDVQSRSLCVRTNIVSDGSSGENSSSDSESNAPSSRGGRIFLFDHFAFEQNGDWHHLVLNHSPRELALFVDGKLRQKFVLASHVQQSPNAASMISANASMSNAGAASIAKSIVTLVENDGSLASSGSKEMAANISFSFGFPSNVSRHEPLTGLIGSGAPNSTCLTSFCGQLGTISIYEGLLEEKHVETLAQEGTLFDSTASDLGISNRVILSVQPADFASNSPAASSSSSTSSVSPASSAVSTHISSTSSAVARNLSLSLSMVENRTLPQVQAGMSVMSLLASSSSSPSPYIHPHQPQDAISPLPLSPTIGTPQVFPHQYNDDGSHTMMTPLSSPLRPPHRIPSSNSDPSLAEMPNSSSSASTPAFHPISTHSNTDTPHQRSRRRRIDSHLPPATVTEWVMPKVEAVVDVHMTHSIKSEIRSVGGPFLCLPFLVMGPAQQIAALRITLALLEKCRANQSLFDELKGYLVIGHLLLQPSAIVMPTLPSSVAAEDVESSHSNELLSFSKRSWSNSSLSGMSTSSVSVVGCELSLDTFDLLLAMVHGTMSTTPTERRLKSVEGLQLVVDLLRRCDANTRTQVVSLLSDMLFNHSSNVETWRRGPGVFGILELLRFAPELLPHLLVMLNQILKVADLPEVEPLINFLLVEEAAPFVSSSSQFSSSSVDSNDGPQYYSFAREKVAISELLRVMFMTRPDMLTKWYHQQVSQDTPFTGFFLLLNSSVETVRLDGIKFLCMMFELNPKHKSAFLKYSGFDVMEMILSRHYHRNVNPMLKPAQGQLNIPFVGHHLPPLSLPICETLLRMSISLYKCDVSSQLADKKLGGEEDKVDYSKHTLVHPESLVVLLRLLGTLAPMSPSQSALQSGSALHIHVVQQLDLLLCERVENIQKWWEGSDVLPSLRQYLLAIRFHAPVPQYVLEGTIDFDPVTLEVALSDNSRSTSIPVTLSTASMLSSLLKLPHPFEAERELILGKVNSLLHKLMWFDLARKHSRCLEQMQSWYEAPDMWVTVIDSLLSHLERKPTLSEDANTVQFLLGNLYQLLMDSENVLTMPYDLKLRLIDCINRMASLNTPVVRMLLKSSGLLTLRETVLLEMCSSMMFMKPSQQYECLSSLSLDSIAASKSFRDTGLIYLLWLFHCPALPPADWTPDTPELDLDITWAAVSSRSTPASEQIHSEDEKSPIPSSSAVSDTAAPSLATITPRVFPEIPILVLELIRHELARHPNLLKKMSRWIMDPYVLRFLLPHVGEDDWRAVVGDWSACIPFFSASAAAAASGGSEATLSPQQQQAQSLMGMMERYSGDATEFVNWYFASAQAPLRASILSRLLPEIQDVSADHLASLSKQQYRRLKYLRSRLETLSEQAQKKRGDVGDIVERSMPPLLDAAYHAYATAQSNAAEARLQRIEDGEAKWELISADLVKFGFLPSALETAQAVESQLAEYETQSSPESESLYPATPPSAIHPLGKSQSSSSIQSDNSSQTPSPTHSQDFSTPKPFSRDPIAPAEKISPLSFDTNAESNSFSSHPLSATSQPSPSRFVGSTRLPPLKLASNPRLPHMPLPREISTASRYSVLSSPSPQGVSFATPSAITASTAFANYIISPVLSPALEPVHGKGSIPAFSLSSSNVASK